MNLYEINDEITKAFEAAVDPETGEIIDISAYQALDSLQMQFGEKIEGVLLWIKNLNADAEALKKEKQSFDERQKATVRRMESLKRYMSNVLNGENFSTERVSVTWRRSESTEYTGDLEALPENCLTLKAPELNKTELKKLLKSGQEIPGARLVENLNIQIK